MNAKELQSALDGLNDNCRVIIKIEITPGAQYESDNSQIRSTDVIGCVESVENGQKTLKILGVL